MGLGCPGGIQELLPPWHRNSRGIPGSEGAASKGGINSRSEGDAAPGSGGAESKDNGANSGAGEALAALPG